MANAKETSRVVATHAKNDIISPPKPSREGEEMSRTKIGIFRLGDYRSKPNELARPNAEEATVQLERALTKPGRASYRIEGFLTRPHEAIEKLGPVDDPLIGVFVHWCYGPHTTDGVIG